MHGPIVNPIWFYLYDIVTKVHLYAVPFIKVITGVFIPLFVLYLIILGIKNTPTYFKKIVGSIVKGLFIALLIIIVVGFLTPSNEMFIAMVIASNVTFERVDLVASKIAEIHDITKQDFIDIITAIKQQNHTETLPEPTTQ